MKTQLRLPAHILELLVAREKDNISDEELATLNYYLDRHPESAPQVEAYLKIIRQARYLQDKRTINQEKAWKNISRQTFKRNRNVQLFRTSLRYAAVFVPLVILLGFLYLYVEGNKETQKQQADIISSARKGKATLLLNTGESIVLDEVGAGEIIKRDDVHILREGNDRISYSSATKSRMHSLIVPRGGEYQLVLPDGTVVVINSDSQLNYPTIFEGDKRKIYLSGEAYFEVKPDNEKPFVVKTPDMQVTVTGTSFNIYNYEDDIAETTLVEGSLSVSSGDASVVELQPGEQASMMHSGNNITVKEVEVNQYTSWVHGFFSFKDMKLKDLAIRMQRWYDVDIDFTHQDVGMIRLTGAMEKDKPIDYLLNLIEKSANVHYTVKDQKILIGME